MTKPKNKVFYSPKMVANSECFSPSAMKPKLVVEDWQAQGLCINIIEPQPATRDELCLAHKPQYVDGILDCKRNNGFGNRSPEVAASLPWTTGAFLSGARYALEHKAIVAAPCSGFHHAGPTSAVGYCTFNGLMVTALALIKDNPDVLVGILDCDEHYGNGTDEILDQNATAPIIHRTVGRRAMQPEHAEGWLYDELPRILDTWFAYVDVLLYQAGADPHVNDPFGGWLTTEQLKRRDETVFQFVQERGIPTVWNLAGGYQYTFEYQQAENRGENPPLLTAAAIRPVLDIHLNTAQAWINCYSTSLRVSRQNVNFMVE